MERRLVGQEGERIAASFIVSRGFCLVEKNCFTPFGEIDIIGEKEGRIVFFEVKTRVSYRFGPPSSAITKAKKEHMIKSCLYYLKRYNLMARKCRIDLLAITLDDKMRLKILKHIRNAVQTDV